jgi:uncharacterized repeat protein (TIGR01451 family)
MKAHNQPTHSLLAVLGVALGVTMAALLSTPPVLAAEATDTAPAIGARSATEGLASSAPQLSIAVDNGHTTAAAGDRLTYTISVQNLGTADVTDLHVTQSMPAGLKFKSADSAGKPKAESVNWTLDLKAADEIKVHSTMTVANTPRELLRMATVACASTSADDPPVVCASHSDQLPAGAAAEAASARSAAPGSEGLNPWYLALGLGLVVAALVVVVVIRRRRTLQSTPSKPASKKSPPHSQQ